ncbi:carbohydrate binding family 9 domain-containing protein [Lutimonas saemankumensis]|uniref:carbohydrate binding family 9 domain-containing protein n=1 Tax=Lutimonas saemankumensis TaxID=483016 RepID=UPI001CD7525F|nr:carbohydrate binding family 9 domain-containing protein [Lutimonas saemankumensis]MCA0931867.1 carbohydrate binding family 9 domain-containing protein [Lutimonas saemankumensis]
MQAQKKNANYRLHIKKATSEITIDGVMDEEAWKETDVAKDFFMVLPADTGRATQQSEVRMAYDENHLYLIAVFYNTPPGPYYVESLRRDFQFGKNDNFLIFMDPFNNQTTGFSFGANAAGAQWDGTMNNGGRVDLNWDSKWISKVTRNERQWVFEMAVPFKSIRYKKGVTEWGINFSRLDLKSSEKSSWTPIPRQFPTASLAYSGVLVWDEPPPAPKINFSLIPYVLGSANVSSLDENNIDYETKVGGDVKFAVTSSLNLDLTLNPDFSQVEVDNQIVNLDRFELFYPEKRQFFLENADLFANFGYANIRPFFSRRIGLDVPIIAGARLSGNLDENWRIGAMDMQTANDETIGLPSQNFATVSLQRKVFSQSSIGFLFVNKESFNYPDESDEYYELYPKYNRNIGFEYNLASYNNLWTGKAFVFKSFSPDDDGNGFTQAANIEYKSQNWNFGFKQEYVADDFRAEVGFVPRKGYFKFNPFLGYLFYPKKNTPILSHGPKWTSIYYFDENMNNTDYLNLLQYFLNFRNRSSFRATFIDEYVELLEPFDPTGTGKPELPAGSQHHWNALRLNYSSKPQSMFTYTIGGRVGGYYEDGSWLSFNNELGYRFQPYVSLSSVISYNNIQMPAPWNTTDFWLVGAKADITFTNKLFFATLFQYNEQSKNFNLNSRFQWRYQPASDLFIVYTYNDLMPPYSESTHSLTLKLVYWFNK